LREIFLYKRKNHPLGGSNSPKKALIQLIAMLNPSNESKLHLARDQLIITD